MKSSDNSFFYNFKKKIIQHRRLFSFIKSFFLAVIIALLINIFILDTTKITSESMEDTILKGDFLFMEKLSYGAKFPGTIPFLKDVIPPFRMPGFSSIERGDIMIFENPLQSAGEKNVFQQNLIKRCIGLPGDTLRIQNRIILINNETLSFDSGIKYEPLPGEEHKVKFPPNSSWTIDNYGPLFIPGKGDVVKLDASNLGRYRKIINEESMGDTISISGNKIYLGTKIISDYKFKNNYCFVLGDNRNRSSDSRFWGFLREDKVIGRAIMIYMSFDYNRGVSFPGNIRWNRIAKLIE